VIDPDFWQGRRVFLTGHTGFKGAWLSLLLHTLGARVFGFALPPENADGAFAAARADALLRHTIGDIRDFAALRRALQEAEPGIVIHMAAQSLVRASYAAPVETYAVNLLGTVHLLEAVRHAPSVAATLVVTSDKCYRSEGASRPYRESDPLGGRDPYSNSKACAELATESYRQSFFAQGACVASARAGNVIGGGDWAQDRIVPDAIRAFRAGKPLVVRNPQSVRPWQHVLDPLLGYLRLCELLAAGGRAFARGWNFGPAETHDVSVEALVNAVCRRWGPAARWEQDKGAHQPHEAAVLRLDCSDAIQRLGWRPVVPLDRALDLTIAWYRAREGGADMRALTLEQIDETLASARASA
jgi:CDP-glucose 4,6-dehydratase